MEAAAESPAAKSPAAASPAVKSPSVSAKKSPAARKAATPKSAGPTPHTAASRALVDAAIENLTAAEQAESAVLAASPMAATKSPREKGAHSGQVARQEGGNPGEVPRQEGAHAQVRGSRPAHAALRARSSPTPWRT